MTAVLQVWFFHAEGSLETGIFHAPIFLLSLLLCLNKAWLLNHRVSTESTKSKLMSKRGIDLGVLWGPILLLKLYNQDNTVQKICKYYFQLVLKLRSPLNPLPAPYLYNSAFQSIKNRKEIPHLATSSHRFLPLVTQNFEVTAQKHSLHS